MAEPLLAEPIAPTDPARADPAPRAANAARVLGVLVTLFAVVALISAGFAVGQLYVMQVIVVLGLVVVCYLGPGVALLVLSGRVRCGFKGPTIAVLVIAILIALLLWAGSAIQILRIITGTASVAILLPFALIAIVALVATLLAIYCVQSLRFPDRIDPNRGFEPVMVPPPLTADANREAAR